MSRRRIVIAAGLATAALTAVGGAGIARAVSGSDSETVSGPAAQRAASAAVNAVGGGQALETEFQDGDGVGVYEVEVRRPDGSRVEVHLNGRFAPVGTQADDDAGETGTGDD